MATFSNVSLAVFIFRRGGLISESLAWLAGKKTVDDGTQFATPVYGSGAPGSLMEYFALRPQANGASTGLPSRMSRCPACRGIPQEGLPTSLLQAGKTFATIPDVGLPCQRARTISVNLPQRCSSARV